MTDWMWCYEQPQEAATTIDELQQRVAELEELRRTAALNHEAVCKAIHKMYERT